MADAWKGRRWRRRGTRSNTPWIDRRGNSSSANVLAPCDIAMVNSIQILWSDFCDWRTHCHVIFACASQSVNEGHLVTA
eukprot:6117830-Pyramimonas_sp.AAC.1